MKRLLLAVAVTFGILVLTPSPSWACSCALSSTPQHVKSAVTIAAGTVDWIATDGQTRTYKVDFDDVYKGAVGQSEKLLTGANEGACGLSDLATGKRYLFFINGQHPGAMRIGRCGGTTPYDAAVARQIEAATGPPGKPLPGPPASSTGDDSNGHARLITLGAGGVLVLAAIGGFAVRRRA